MNAGAAIGYPQNPNATGPLFIAVIKPDGSSLALPPGWVSARLAVGTYRITHNLNSALYVCFTDVQANSKSAAVPFNYLPNSVDVNTYTIPAGTDADLIFGLLLIRS